MSVRLLVLASLVAFLPTAPSWAAGLTFGFEGQSVLTQDMVLLADPVLTRIDTDNQTTLTTFRTMNYMREIRYDGISTTTYQREWNDARINSNYLYIKMAYSTPMFEASAKMGSADKTIQYEETSVSISTSHNPGVWSRNTISVQNQKADLAQGFAYGFEIRGQPYDTENFSIMASLRFDHSLNTGDLANETAITYSTTGAVLQQSSTESELTISHMRYGLAVVGALKFEFFSPYLGFDYMESRFKVANKWIEVLTTSDMDGNVTNGDTVIGETNYTLKPKIPIGALIGFTIPFERGGVNLEARLRGDTSIKMSGYIGF